MATRLDVYISSTSRDLVIYRERAVQAILRLGLFPIMMESFAASDTNALQLCYDRVQEAEIFVGLYGYRYGWIPGPDVTYMTSDGEPRSGDGETSITHWEYLWALERNIPLLLFIARDDMPLRPEDYEDEPGKSRLQEFKSLLKSQHVVAFFSSPDDLAAQLIQALASLLARQSQMIGQNRDEECISNFDDRVLNATLKALELSATFKSSEARQDLTEDGRHTLRVQPVFSTPPSKLPQYQCDVFVIMPFSEEFEAVYVDVIKPVCEGLGLVVKRGDDFFANHYIMEEIWFAINNSRLVIADCTGRNANVFYELGIAHTLGRPTISITQDVKDLPFDVAGRRSLQYENTFEGPKKLTRELRESILLVLNTAYPDRE